MTEAIAYARMGLVPAGAYKNREFAAEGLDAGDIEEVYLDLISDPQTSGGADRRAPQNPRESAQRPIGSDFGDE